VTVLGDNVDNVKQNKGTVIDASEEAGLEINAEKAKYMLLSHYQNAGQNRDMKIANKLFEIMSQFRYLGTIVTNRNLIQEEIERKLNSGTVRSKTFCILVCCRKT
jgi:nucleoside diphosphate kinase